MMWETWGIIMDHLCTHAPQGYRVKWWAGRTCNIKKHLTPKCLREDTPESANYYLRIAHDGLS